MTDTIKTTIAPAFAVKYSQEVVALRASHDILRHCWDWVGREIEYSQKATRSDLLTRFEWLMLKRLKEIGPTKDNALEDWIWDCGDTIEALIKERTDYLEAMRLPVPEQPDTYALSPAEVRAGFDLAVSCGAFGDTTPWEWHKSLNYEVWE